ncbi:MAG: hypothetical protein ACLQVG_20510 [Terriglobia bacterium]
MPSWTSNLRTAIGGSSSKPSPNPTQIRNKFYNSMREFTAWSPWGEKPDHTNKNSHYIEISGLFVKQYDYPAQVQKLINHGWKTGSKPSGPRPTGGFTLGRTRPDAPPGFQQQPAPFRQGVSRPLVNNWDHMTLFEQVGAYAFRGDTRPPEPIKSANGFHPPSSRTDDSYLQNIAEHFVEYMDRREGLHLDATGRAQMQHEVEAYLRSQVTPADRKLLVEYHFWREILSHEQLHLRGMTDESFLKGYISTTRDVDTARLGALGMLGGKGTQTTNDGWIYVLRVDSGFLLKTGVGGISKQEAEIAHMGPVLWDKLYGFVHIGVGAEKVVYIRNMFDQQDFKAFKLVLASLSAMV